MALDIATPLSPDWWLLREGRRLRARGKSLDRWWRYYSGDHPLPQGPRKAVAAYLDFQRMSRTNLMAFIVDSVVHRTAVIGVNGANGQEDSDAWGWWQDNRMDARQFRLYRTALALSTAYAMVSEHPRIDGRPLVTVEHPRQTITEEDPETGEQAAGAKWWYDDIRERGRANVYLPDQTIRYITARRGKGPLPITSTSAWERMDGNGDAPILDHGFGQLPLVPFYCRPELGEEPAADFERVISVQDRINLGVLNRMTAERYGAFRQRYVTGHKFRKRVDPISGLEVVEQPFKPDPGSLWASEGGDTKFGEFSQTELTGYLRSHESDVRAALVLSHTPGYYYATDLINISADTVTAMDANHVAKVLEFHAEWGESHEDVLRLCAKVAGKDSTDRSRLEVRWRDPRQLNPAVLADQAVKLQAAGYPLAVIAAKCGESPQTIKAILSAAASQNLLAAAMTGQAQANANAALAARSGSGAGGAANPLAA